MRLPRRGLEVDAMFRQSFQRGFIDAVSNTECFRSRHGAVGQKRKTDVLLLNCLMELRGLIRRDSDYLESELAELRPHIAQLDQLPVAMRSPAAAIKHQHYRLCTDRLD